MAAPHTFWRCRLVAGWGDATNATIQWSEPECVLYSHDATDRIGYPDLFFGEAWETHLAASSSSSSSSSSNSISSSSSSRSNYTLFMTETNKRVARLHAIDAGLVNGLKGQRTNARLPESPDWARSWRFAPTTYRQQRKHARTSFFDVAGTTRNKHTTLLLTIVVFCVDEPRCPAAGAPTTHSHSRLSCQTCASVKA